MSETKGALRGVSWKGFAVGFVCVILISVFYSFSFIELVYTMPLLAFQNNGNDNYYQYSFFTLIWAVSIVVVIIAVINRIKPVLSREDVAVILIMTAIAGLQDSAAQWSHNPWSIFTFVPSALAFPDVFAERISLFKQYLSPVMFPNWDYFGMTAGSSMAVDWAIVLPNTIFVIAFMSCIYIAITFWLMLFRRTFVEVERLSFPISIIYSNLVEFTQPSSLVKTSEKRLFNKKWFLLGFAIAFLYIFGSGINYAYPATITMYDIAQGKPGWGYIYGTTINISPDRPLSHFLIPMGLWTVVTFSFRELYIGWCSLLSIDVLISIIVGFVLFYLVFPSFYSGIWGAGEGGAMDAWPRLTGVWGVQEDSWVQGASVNLFTIGLGLFLGILIWTIITNKDTLIFAMKGLFKEPEEEADPYKPLPYRTTWLIFLIALLGSILLSMVINLDPLVFAVFMVLMLIFMMGWVRYYGESGADFGTLGEPAKSSQPMMWISVLVVAIFGLEYLIGPGGEQYYNTVRIMTLAIMGALFFKTFQMQSTMHASTTMDAAKTGRTYNISLKDMVLKTIIPATVLAGAVQTITRQILIHWMPWGKFTVLSWQHFETGTQAWTNAFDQVAAGSPNVGWGGVDGMVQAGSVLLTIQSYPLDYAWKLVFGVALALGIYILQRRYTWLRLSVAGLLVGLTVSWMLIFPAIIALIIRFLVVRLYGPDVYEEKVTPLMVGLIIGGSLAWFLLMPFHDLFYIYFTEQAKVGPW